MSKFTEAELAYLQSQRLGRLATVNARGEPQVAAVGFRYNPEFDTIDIGGYDLANTQKFRNIARNGLASFLVDDVLPPWKTRSFENYVSDLRAVTAQTNQLSGDFFGKLSDPGNASPLEFEAEIATDRGTARMSVMLGGTPRRDYRAHRKEVAVGAAVGFLLGVDRPRGPLCPLRLMQVASVAQ